jgi:amino acid transporter
MEEQKNNRTLSLLSNMGMALLGAVISVGFGVFVWYFSGLLNMGLLAVWFVVLVGLIIFFLMPVVAYRQTGIIKTMCTVLGLQVLCVLILIVIARSCMWWIYLG